tara:strand:- start:206 stop:547 length:342 start_codon:yes stop_codon:yes gene_type:complete
MEISVQNPSTFITKVSTFSKNDNRKKTVKLKVVYWNKNIFLTRRNKDSNWYKNLLLKKDLEIEINGIIYKGNAYEMNDENIINKVSNIKYSDKPDRIIEQRFGFKVDLLGEIQ